MSHHVNILTLFMLSGGLTLTACGEADGPRSAASGGPGGGGGSGGGGSSPTFGACEGLAPGPRGTGELAVALSTAHASFRFFGPHTSTIEVDAALAGALGVSRDDETLILPEYVTRLGSGCAMQATDAVPSAAKVELRGDVAWVRFGSGAITIPNAASSVIVDLRGTIEGPTLDGFLDAVSEAIVQGPVPSLTARARAHYGMRDEAYGPIILHHENMYDDEMEQVELPPLATGAARFHKVGLLCGERMAPRAAGFALTLRSAARAVLLGHEVHAAVAESVWHGVGTFGFAHRAFTLESGGGDLPDIVAADVVGDDEDELAAAFANVGELAPVSGAADRPALQPIANNADPPAADAALASREAALIIAHGAMKRFFPYWNVVDDESDQRLVDAIALAESESDGGFWAGRHELGFLAHALHDSHGFVFHATEPPVGALIPAILDQSSTMEPVVRASLVAELAPGDTIVTVDGVVASQVMAERSQFVASSDSSAFRNAADTLLRFNASTTLGVRDAAGVLREVTLDAGGLPQGYPQFPARAAGPLGDLGHPELYYVNLDYGVLTAETVDAAIDGVMASQGVVLDMRGYPSEPAWALVSRLLTKPTLGVPMRVPLATVLRTDLLEAKQPFPADAQPFQGKVAMVVGSFTQSQAEHLTLLLQSADRVRVIGQPTAGANGNITGVLLPGGFCLTFTGMEVRQPDLSVFHGVGVKLDELVPVDVQNLALGIDAELARAVEWLIAS